MHSQQCVIRTIRIWRQNSRASTVTPVCNARNRGELIARRGFTLISGFHSHSGSPPLVHGVAVTGTVVSSSGDGLRVRIDANESIDCIVPFHQVVKPVPLHSRHNFFVTHRHENGAYELSMRPFGKLSAEEHRSVLLRILAKNGGFISVKDSDSVDSFKARFGMSKRQFRSAAGRLYSLRRILFVPQGVASVPAPLRQRMLEAMRQRSLQKKRAETETKRLQLSFDRLASAEKYGLLSSKSRESKIYVPKKQNRLGSYSPYSGRGRKSALVQGDEIELPPPSLQQQPNDTSDYRFTDASAKAGKPKSKQQVLAANMRRGIFFSEEDFEDEAETRSPQRRSHRQKRPARGKK